MHGAGDLCMLHMWTHAGVGHEDMIMGSMAGHGDMIMGETAHRRKERL